MPLSPEDRKQLLAEIGRGKQKGALKTQASVDAYVAERTGGAVKSLEDLIPSAPEPTIGEHVLGGLKMAGQGALGLGEMGMTAASGGQHPLGEAGQQVMGALPQMVLNAVPLAAPMSGAPLAALGQRMGMNVHPPSGIETAGAGLGMLMPEAAPWLQILAAPVIGASQSPNAPIEGATAGLATMGAAKALPPIAGMAGRVGDMVSNPSEAAGAGAVMRTTLPASGGVAGIRNAMSQYGPSVSGANPMLAEYSRAGMEGLSEAASKSPELWNYLKTVFEKRGKVASVADAIRAKRNTEVGPKLDAFKADPTPFQMSSAPYTIGQAQHMPAAAQAVREAISNGWKPPIGSNGFPDPATPIPGSQGGGWLAGDPYILEAAKKLPKGGVPPGTPNPDIAAGEAPTQGQTFVLRKILDDQIKKTKGVENVDALKATRDRLDAELRTQSPTYAGLMKEWSVPTKLAEQYEKQVGKFTLPQSPGALGGHTPLGLNPTSLITRPGVFNFLDAWRRSKAQSAGAVLASQASGTPLTIEQVLQSLGSK